MSDAVEILERPTAREIYMLAGWRQWADAGSISSGLPRYLIGQTNARKIGSISPNGFYLFQIPGTHDLVRPVVKFDNGYPVALETRKNDIYYAGDDEQGMVFFIGDEPHLNVDQYVATFLDVAKRLNVKRIISFGGVYGELPYDKERMVSSIISRRSLRSEIADLSVNTSDYHGGASIGSYLCRRAGEQNMDYIGFYAFVPTYDFSRFQEIGNIIRIENDYMAWLGVMRRVKHMLKLKIDLTDLEEKRNELLRSIESKVDELDNMAPQIGLRDYFAELSAGFTELIFDPLGDVWTDELNRLFDDSESGEGS
ncbi:MAG: PAC2 family protein [Chloroflexi bacterium]|nr:MAG: PAC2 family protein [Chloroflexota bacterium]